eukprot:sb/3473198/
MCTLDSTQRSSYGHSDPARFRAIWAVTVLLPTPPFPDKTRILCLTLLSATATSEGEVSVLNWPVEHACLLGHPAQPSIFPASSDAGPGQDAGTLSGSTIGAIEFLLSGYGSYHQRPSYENHYGGSSGGSSRDYRHSGYYDHPDSHSASRNQQIV